jgi:murein DD-endopeptidase MepM/ murein hydrolase activator NlpD
MNLFSIFLVLNLYSYKRELFYVSLTFLFFILIPIIYVIVITNTGIQVISEKLISLDLKTHLIELHDPMGKVFATLNDATVWPVRGIVTLNFGESDLPYQPFHTGIDIAGKIGDPITPFLKGKVIHVGHLSWGYGEHIIIDHGNNLTSLYGHLSSVNVKEGDDVKPGDVIGLEGTTGWSTGPHLHFEIRLFGIPIDPTSLL